MKFKCERCGYCCTLRVRLSFLELLRIISRGYKKKDFAVKDMKKRNCIRQHENGDCYFLVRKGRKTSCKIYDIRPKMCRAYPGYIKGKCKSVNPAVRASLKSS